MKFALITELNWGFRYGLNGILNGLDYHGNTEIDVHYLYDLDVPEWYRVKAAETFDFKVKGYSIDEYQEMRPPPVTGPGLRRWRLLYYSYYLAMDLTEYDAVMIVDADMLVLGNLENYFKAVAGTDLIMVPNWNGLNGGCDIDHVNGSSPEQWKDKIGNHVFAVILCSPVVFDPRRNVDFCKETLKQAVVTHSQFRAILWAMIELDRLKDCIVLPNLFWVNPQFHSVPYSYAIVNGKRAIFVHGDRVMMAHRRWWNPQEMQREIDEWDKTPEDRELSIKNMGYFTEECKEINTNWKLPLDWTPA